MQRAVLIYNAAAGINRRASTLDDLREILTRGGVEVRLQATEGPGHATEIAHEVRTSGSEDTVLVYGGDGTLREAAKGLLDSDIALAPLSAGTTNVVTRSLGLPVNPRKAARALLTAEPVECDVGLCNDEHFLILVSLGVDAAVMANVSSRFKNLAGRGAVVIGGVATLWKYQFPMIHWTADGESGSSSFLAVSNIAEYGGDFKLAPGASFFDHRLTLTSFTGTGKLAMIRFALNLVLGRQLRMAGVASHPVDELRIEGPIEAPLELDGDYLQLEPPLLIRLSRQRVRLLQPKVAVR